MNQATITAGDNGHSTPPPPQKSLIEQLTDEIAAVEGDAKLMLTQIGEVAAKFLRCARALALEGKDELEQRKRKAARCVLTGKYEDE